MHYNIPSDKITFWGLMFAAIFLVCFIVSKMKNASSGVKLFLGILVILVVAVGAALASDYYNLVPNFDFVPWL